MLSTFGRLVQSFTSWKRRAGSSPRPRNTLLRCESLESRELLATDIVMGAVTADGFATLSVSYDILNADATPFEIGFYRSRNGLVDGSDFKLDAVSVAAAGDLTMGAHTLTFPIGKDAGEVRLPGTRGAENNEDYKILAFADDLLEVAEDDEDNNVSAFFGVYQAKKTVFIHGKDIDDIVNLTSGATINVDFNGTVTNYGLKDIQRLRIRVHDGDDTVAGDSVKKAMFILGGDGEDDLRGGILGDIIRGGRDNDLLRGNAGNDRLDGEEGDDFVRGGDGKDTWIFQGTSGKDVLNARYDNVNDELVANRRDTVGGTVLEADRATGIRFMIIQGHARNDQITVASDIGISGLVDGGDGSDTCNVPSKWKKINCEG